ncbi:dynein axonemal assembly factor 4-like isoform X1 [Homarus americanus]|uniref:dynein axonemal assembly factor 4-like isoform X1 n=1 Tax=Homarus americanus TaxID=6706 RepID=UPI001C46B5DF|nr:dynein axonemal assembly factor 4-like isoform X1 [Homarus americanus]XP_042217047.1 dynein axonemal assembly factor 4-like isoform X1 [Homarus americanus]XP_042217048.1 dynein axonemal assembly factor 4-like isoform X1 [Homarus americanus]
MPIHVTDYTWQQTSEKILLSLDLHQTSPKNVDIVTTNSYLKVSFLPYIFEAFLCHMINADQSTAQIMKGQIKFDLAKEDHVHWSDLCLKLSREEMQNKRQEAIKDVEEQEKKSKSKKKRSVIAVKDLLSLEQISEDDKVREERKKLIEREKTDFLKQTIEDDPQNNQTQDATSKPDIRRRISSMCSEDGTAVAQEMDYDGDGEDSIYYSSTENLHLKNGNVKIDKVDNGNRKQRKSSSIRKAALKDKEEKRKEEKKKVTTVPPVWENCIIKVKHTTRVFPTPSRESTQAEEQQWLTSQSVHSSAAKDFSSESSEEHLKKKAISLFSNGDYRGCVNACTEALKVNPCMSSLYSNRAAANLALNNLHHTINDCTKALELLTPPTEDNSKSRLLCHIRRGTAFVRLGLLSEGLAEYQAAHQITPENKTLKKDVEKIQAMITTSTDSGDSNEDDSGCGEDGVSVGFHIRTRLGGKTSYLEQ